MDEDILNLLAGIVYVVVPISLISMAFTRVSFRPKAFSILGAISPISISFLYVAADFFVNERTGEDAFGFYAMWIMGFSAYVLSVLVGIAFAFVRRPRQLIGRYLLPAGIVLASYFSLELF